MGARFYPLFCAVAFLCLTAGIGSAQQLEPRPLITKPIVESQLVTLKGNTHPLARPQFDAGAAPPDLPMERMLLVLKRSPEQEYALRTLLDNQHDKASPHFHKWLKPEEFGRQFGPSDQDLQAVTGWLEGHGFQVNRVSHGRTMIEFSGVAAQVEQALHTSIHKYVVNREEHWANASDPQIPAALAPAVAGIWSLHNFHKKPMVHYSPAPVAFERGPRGQITFPNPPGPDIHALGPQDYATIYNINPVYQNGINGQGQTIAVVGRSTFNSFDVQDFFATFQLPCPSVCPPVNVVNDGPPPSGITDPGEQAEATLDVTWSAAIAPGATVDFVLSDSTNTTDGVDLSELYIVDNDLAGIMTESFGICEAAFTTTQADGTSLLAEQAAAEGITYMVSAGDTGAEGCDFQGESVAQGPLSVNVLASTPFTVAVGGTMFNEGGDDSKYWSSSASSLETALSYIPEDVWNESCTVAQCGLNSANILAGGGGVSSIFQKPAWQSPTLFPTLNIPNDGFRDMPDISLTSAGHDPYLLCLFRSCSNGFIYFIWGTSAAAPSFAGMVALVDEKMAQVNQITGPEPQGQANYVLYSLASQETFSQCNGSGGLSSGNTCVFNDVTVGNNAVPGESSYGSSSPQYAAGVAYDPATGLGSVNVANLVNAWSSATFNASTTTIAITPAPVTPPLTITHGSPVTFNITVAGNSGTPTGDVALLAQNPSLAGTRSVGVATLASGSGTLTTSALPGGTINVSASYPGDGKFAPSTSATQAIVVSPETSTTSVVAMDQNQNQNFSPAPYGSFVYVRADVKGSSGSGTPTGNVSFQDNTVPVFSETDMLNSQGNTAMVDQETLFSVGSHSITGTYNGDPSFSASQPSTPVTFTITQASTSTGLSSAGAPQGATLTATISTASLGNQPTGSVTFTSGANDLGSATVQTSTGPTGQVTTASLTDSQLANGQYTITAAYGGDTNYTASTSAPTTVNIQPDFSIQPSNNVLVVNAPGESATMTIQMTDLDGFTGTVTFSCSGLPSEASCAFSPNSLSATGPTTLTVSTKAKTGMAIPFLHRSNWALAASLFGMMLPGMFLISGRSKRKTRRKLILALLLGTICAGCGGASGGPPPPPPPDPGTPAGNYVVTINATSGSIAHSAQFGLGVF